MPIYPEQLPNIVSIIAQLFGAKTQQESEMESAQQNFAKFLNPGTQTNYPMQQLSPEQKVQGKGTRPNPYGPGTIPSSYYQGVPGVLPGVTPVTSQRPPLSPSDPEFMGAIAKLVTNPYGAEMLRGYQGALPQYNVSDKGMGGTDIIKYPGWGQEPTVKQAIPPTFKPGAPTFGFDAQGNPAMMQSGMTGQMTTAPSPITTAQMQTAKTGVAKAETAKTQGQQRLDISNESISAPQQDVNGRMGVVITNKTTGHTRFEPVGVQGQQKAGSLSGSTKTMLEAAPNVKYFVNKVLGEVDQMEQGLGPAASRWREFKAGNIGLADPGFTELRTNVGLLTTLLMRMHVGARGGEYIMKHFEELLGSGKQSPENLRAALGQVGQYADQLMSEHKTATQAGQSPQGKATHRYNPTTGQIEVIR